MLFFVSFFVKHAARGLHAAHQLIQSSQESNLIKWIDLFFLIDFFSLSIISIYCFFVCSLETSPITDSDIAKRTVFQRSYSVVASEYDKQHSALPARIKAMPRRRVHSGDAGTPPPTPTQPSPPLNLY